jgi:soluble lytic murein transglycosylase-like protein
MIAQIKAGLILGAAVVGAVPPAYMLVRTWDLVEPAKQHREQMQTDAMPTAAPKVTLVSAKVSNPPPPSSVDARLSAGFTAVEHVAQSDGTVPAFGVPTAFLPADPPADPVKILATRPDAPAPLLPPMTDSARQSATLPATANDKVAELTSPPPAEAPLPVETAMPRPKPAVPAASHDGVNAMVETEAKAAGVPVKLALAVIEVESGFDARKHGEDGKAGLFQLRYSIAKALGFKGKAEDLDDPATNVKWGMKYLAGAYKRADGDTCKTAMKFIAGHYQDVYKPVHAAYCKKLEDRMAAME